MKKHLGLSLVLLTIATSVFAESFAEGYRRFDDSIRRFLMDGLDSEYIGIPATSWEALLLCNGFGDFNHYTTSAGTAPLSYADQGCELAVGIGYHGLDLCYGFELAPQKSVFNFAFDYFDNSWGVGINILNSNSKYMGETFRSNAMVLNAYYAFNGKKFCYPSSCYANYIQKKSVGSPIVEAWYERYTVTPRGPALVGLLGSTQGEKLQSHTGAVVGGYSYNFVWLEGKIVFNLTGAAGLFLPAPGAALKLRAGGIFWINDHFRFNVNAYGFGVHQLYTPKGWANYSGVLWRTQCGFEYCF